MNYKQIIVETRDVLKRAIDLGDYTSQLMFDGETMVETRMLKVPDSSIVYAMVLIDLPKGSVRIDHMRVNVVEMRN